MSAQRTCHRAQRVRWLPREIDCIPSIAGIAFTPATMSLGVDLGQRASLAITFKDHRHVMNGEPYDQGTFWGKWRARYGQKLRGRKVRWINGLLGTPIGNMPSRHLFIDSTDGPSPDGTYTIVAKDLLKFADDERALAPRLSNGMLAGGLNTVVASATLSPSGVGNNEYPASGHICLGGKEIVSFTRSGDALTIVRAQLGTTAKAVYVFRGSRPLVSVASADPGGEGTGGNPAAQTVTAGSGLPPLVVLGGYYCFNAAINPRTFTVGGVAAKDGEINVSGFDGGGGDMWLAYKIFNAAPTDAVIDMDDEGTQILQSCYIACS